MPNKILTGKIVSDKMEKTVVVAVESKVAHPMYKKLIKRTQKFKADTNNLELRSGDTVVIQETKPKSKGKYFKVISKEEK